MDADVLPSCNEGDISDVCSGWTLELFRLRDEENTAEVFIEYFKLTVLKPTLRLV